MDQLYVVFILADGGKDLESFAIFNFEEVQSVLLQVVRRSPTYSCQSIIVGLT